MDKKQRLDMDVSDIIMERPHAFSVDGYEFYIYPACLGKIMLLSRLVDALNLDKRILAVNPAVETLRVATSNKEDVCRIIAYHTFNNKMELFDEYGIQSRTKLFAQKMSVEEVSTLFTMVLLMEETSQIMKHLGIDAERRRQEKVSKAKKEDRNTYTFGGRSLMGALIIPACEKLSMTPSQVVWDISYQFLQLLMADAVTQIYLTDQERKNCKVSNDKDVINADTPEGMARIKSMCWD